MVGELLIVLVVVLLLFGATKLPALARGMGRSKQEYQAGQFDPVRPDPEPPPED
jgi:sec-independent protein translocase protein TatA